MGLLREGVASRLSEAAQCVNPPDTDGVLPPRRTEREASTDTDGVLAPDRKRLLDRKRRSGDRAAVIRRLNASAGRHDQEVLDRPLALNELSNQMRIAR
jgi:hypothetical protein